MKKAVTYRLDPKVIEMISVIQKYQEQQIQADHPHIKIKISLADVVETAIRKEFTYWTGEDTI